jgi:hypothetical protein
VVFFGCFGGVEDAWDELRMVSEKPAPSVSKMMGYVNPGLNQYDHSHSEAAFNSMTADSVNAQSIWRCLKSIWVNRC